MVLSVIGLVFIAFLLVGFNCTYVCIQGSIKLLCLLSRTTHCLIFHLVQLIMGTKCRTMRGYVLMCDMHATWTH